jgi:hypothetical protein
VGSDLWFWKTAEKISYNDGVRNEVMLRRVKEDRNVLQTIERRDATTWIVYILFSNYLQKHIIKEKMEDKMDGKTRNKK